MQLPGCRGDRRSEAGVLRILFAGNLLIVHSDPGDDLDPSLVHRLEALSLLLRILVWDGADEVVARLPSFSILLGCRSMMILSTSISVMNVSESVYGCHCGVAVL
jgi:hypothetical protein